MPFNFTRKYTFLPSFTLDDTNLEVVYSTKLLRLTLTRDCKEKFKTLVFMKTKSTQSKQRSTEGIYGWNLPGGTSLLAECHQIMCKGDVLLDSFF